MLSLTYVSLVIFRVIDALPTSNWTKSVQPEEHSFRAQVMRICKFRVIQNWFQWCWTYRLHSRTRFQIMKIKADHFVTSLTKYRRVSSESTNLRGWERASSLPRFIRKPSRLPDMKLGRSRRQNSSRRYLAQIHSSSRGLQHDNSW